MKIWTDRLVEPDGLVIMPESVLGMMFDYPSNESPVVHVSNGGSSVWMPLKHARRDRCTDMPDKAGVVIYERDRVRDVDNGRIYTVFAMPTGEWRMMSQYGKDVSLCHADVEVIGMEPYGEVDHV